ncbi:glycosyltransferase [Streptomyces sp. NPDC049915]|uniref:bifunctional glycosyltransferase/CDP-glycerol:glycerophosphate glycerophosphotransferase n=1 Tax=Streptomyces sp. NPDC049915 TaxID=3155510 RepID=UPI00342C27C9
MPRFSVIVPAFQVQAYLPACLESVLSQSYTDWELIAVDDGSPDACGALIDEAAAGDPRVRAVHLPENSVAGPARTTGLARTGGDYLLFLDGDDTLAPGALRAIADRVKEAGEPDVLVYGHTRVSLDGRVVRATRGRLLTERGPAPFRLEDRAGLLGLPPAAWDKVCRRERVGLALPQGRHAEVPWSYPLMLSAQSLATLDRVCVQRRERLHHRGRGDGGRAGRADVVGQDGRLFGVVEQYGRLFGVVEQYDRLFGVVEQYGRLFAFVERHPELRRWRPVLSRRMSGHLATLAARPARLPRSARAEFARLVRALHRRHGTAGFSAPLVRFGLLRTVRALRLTAAAARRTGRLAVRLARGLRVAALRLHYRVQRCLPLRADRAVFTAEDERGYGGDPGALEAAFRTHAPHIRTAWITRPEHGHTVPPGPHRLAPGTAAYWTALARSLYLVAGGEPLSTPAERPPPADPHRQITH